MYLTKQIEGPLSVAIENTSDKEQAHLFLVSSMISNKRSTTPAFITANIKPLNRYSIQPGKTFATSPSDKVKYKVLRVLADDIVLQNTHTRKIETFQVDRLLNDWSRQGIKEVSALEDIIQTVKTVLGPVLGIFLTTALIDWITRQIGK